MPPPAHSGVNGRHPLVFSPFRTSDAKKRILIERIRWKKRGEKKLGSLRLSVQIIVVEIIHCQGQVQIELQNKTHCTTPPSNCKFFLIYES